jgi:hypothetical protein
MKKERRKALGLIRSLHTELLDCRSQRTCLRVVDVCRVHLLVLQREELLLERTDAWIAAAAAAAATGLDGFDLVLKLLHLLLHVLRNRNRLAVLHLAQLIFHLDELMMRKKLQKKKGLTLSRSASALSACALSCFSSSICLNFDSKAESFFFSASVVASS